MSDLLNKLQALIGKTSTESTTGSSGAKNTGSSNGASGSSASSYNDVSVFADQSGANTVSSATQMNDEDYFWWQERIEEQRQEELQGETTEKSFDESKLDPKEWNSLEPKANHKLFSSEVKDYTFTTSGGTKIDLADIEGVKIYENSSTGEVIIVGANGATINAGGKDTNITIYDSDIKKLDTDQGNDEIKIYNSNVGEITTGRGADNVLIENSEVKKIDTDSGNDNVFVSNGSVETLKTGNGEDILVLDETDAGNVKTGNDSDKVLANDSTVQKFDSAEGNDDLNVYDSTFGEITTGKGMDNVVTENSVVDNINTGSGSDTVNVKDSTIGGANTSSEVLWGFFDHAEDTVTLVDSEAGTIKTGKGDDNVIASGSDIGELNTGKGENNVSLDDTDVDTSKTGKNDTVVENGNYLDIDKTKLAELGADAVIQLGDGTTTTVGEYTQYLLSQPVGFETEEEYQNYVLESLTSNLDAMKSMYASQEDKDGIVSDGYNALKELTGLGISDKDIEEMIAKQEEMVNGLTAALNGESDMTFEEAYEYYTGTTYSKEKIDKYMEVANTYSAMMTGCQYDENYMEEFEAATGMSVEEATKEFALCQLDTFGKSTGFYELAEKYNQDQEGFKDKLSSIISTAGMFCTAAGAVLSLCGLPMIGVPLLTAGKYVALTGMYIDNALDLVDDSTDKDGLTMGEFGENLFEACIETVSFKVGRLIGKTTNNINSDVVKKILEKGGSDIIAKIAGQAAETGTDMALSLAADYVISQAESFMRTGELIPWDDYWSLDRFISEGGSQLVGILTGVSSTKVSAYQQSVLATATAKINAGDVDGAKAFLKKSGMNFDDDGFNSLVKDVQDIDAQGLTPKQLGSGEEFNACVKTEAKIDETGKKILVTGEQNSDILKAALPEGQDYYRVEVIDDQGNITYEIKIADKATAEAEAYKEARKPFEKVIKQASADITAFEQELEIVKKNIAENQKVVQDFNKKLGQYRFNIDEISEIQNKIKSGEYDIENLKADLSSKNKKAKCDDAKLQEIYSFIENLDVEDYSSKKTFIDEQKAIQTELNTKLKNARSRLNSAEGGLKNLTDQSKEKHSVYTQDETNGDHIYHSEIKENADSEFVDAGEKVVVPNEKFEELTLYINSQNYSFIDVTDPHAMHRLFGRYAKVENGKVVDIDGAKQFLDTIAKYINSDEIYHQEYSSDNDVQVGFFLSKGKSTRGGISLLIKSVNSKNEIVYDNIIIDPHTGKITTVICDVSEKSARENFVPISKEVK